MRLLTPVPTGTFALALSVGLTLSAQQPAAPPWHLASPAGDGMTCRLAMNAFSDLAHSFEAGPAAGGRGAGRGPQ